MFLRETVSHNRWNFLSLLDAEFQSTLRTESWTADERANVCASPFRKKTRPTELTSNIEKPGLVLQMFLGLSNTQRRTVWFSWKQFKLSSSCSTAKRPSHMHSGELTHKPVQTTLTWWLVVVMLWPQMDEQVHGPDLDLGHSAKYFAITTLPVATNVDKEFFEVGT